MLLRSSRARGRAGGARGSAGLLLKRGFEPDYPWQKFERGVEAYAATTELRIGPADERFGSVTTTSPSEWARCSPRGTPALGMGGTLTAARGRGAQNAILAARIARARELGLVRVVTETGLPQDGNPGPSYRNILRAGLEPAYVRPNYRAPA